MSSLQAQPLVNDYVVMGSRGRAIALQNLGIIVGDLLTFLVILTITREMNPYDTFMVMSLFGCSMACLFLLLVKEPDMRKIQSAGDDSTIVDDERYLLKDKE